MKEIDIILQSYWRMFPGHSVVYAFRAGPKGIRLAVESRLGRWCVSAATLAMASWSEIQAVDVCDRDGVMTLLLVPRDEELFRREIPVKPLPKFEDGKLVTRKRAKFKTEPGGVLPLRLREKALSVQALAKQYMGIT